MAKRSRRINRPELKYLNWTCEGPTSKTLTSNPTSPITDAPFLPYQGWYSAFGYNADDANGTGVFRMKQGAGAQDRIGRKVVLKSIFFRIFAKATQTGYKVLTSTNCGFRFMLLLDTQANGTIPTADDVFDDHSAGIGSDEWTGGVISTQRLMRIENSQRFRVIMDKTISMGDGSVIVRPITANPDGAVS